MANTYTLIEGKTLGSSTASVTFSSIPQTYTDLLLKVSARSDWSNAINSDSLIVRPNGSSSNLNSIRLYGSGSAAGSDTNDGVNFIANANSTASTFGSTEIYIPNYTLSNYKSISSDSASETNATTVYMGLFATLWSNTAAITSIQLLPQNGTNLVQYSTFYLYGISNS
jgi:hypothetical protein